MLEEIIREIELNLGKDNFEAVEPLLQFIERHPLDNFGCPGAIVRFELLTEVRTHRNILI